MLQSPLIRFEVKHMSKTKGYRAEGCSLAYPSELAPTNLPYFDLPAEFSTSVFCHLSEILSPHLPVTTPSQLLNYLQRPSLLSLP